MATTTLAVALLSTCGAYAFGERLVERWLERAFAILTDPCCPHLAIIDIAFASGLGDASLFQPRVSPAHRRHAVRVRAAATMQEQK